LRLNGHLELGIAAKKASQWNNIINITTPVLQTPDRGFQPITHGSTRSR
jgi:hypothetical protein